MSEGTERKRWNGPSAALATQSRKSWTPLRAWMSPPEYVS
uniref:Macaca fascicularis brain cDNA clone: QflA-21314, similar to human zinc finger, ZZ-type with EF hand domain 1 (ZZEF1), mRNA, RefSeq: NM_015113.2 n=1 Tax=Macaca fascicularis TaxID=9541 RepID=I7GD50_MACFA|nr:unnamed protein product [Macaca fascicularis]